MRRVVLVCHIVNNAPKWAQELPQSKPDPGVFLLYARAQLHVWLLSYAAVLCTRSVSTVLVRRLINVFIDQT